MTSFEHKWLSLAIYLLYGLCLAMTRSRSFARNAFARNSSARKRLPEIHLPEKYEYVHYYQNSSILKKDERQKNQEVFIN